MSLPMKSLIRAQMFSFCVASAGSGSFFLRLGAFSRPVLSQSVFHWELYTRGSGDLQFRFRQRRIEELVLI